ncbi:MAG: DUF4350 domain-containing protein [Leptolyngbya sp. SIO4C1]|nr:DUF4350 domain-containing protein [Leptolyngbya sp. SIO4C1]
MKQAFSRRATWIGLAGLVALVLLVLLLAPNSQAVSGSSFSRAPDGYLGWYQDRQAAGIAIARWQRPPAELLAHVSERAEPQTLIQVRTQLVAAQRLESQPWVKDWLRAGNRLIVLGIRRPVTAADFITQQASPQGTVRIHTRRRETYLEQNRSVILGDAQGAMVWRETWNPGELIFAVTPHLAANAYQSADNFAFLSAIAGAGPLWVDEFLHGYRAPEAIAETVASSWFDYLRRTPILLAVVQAAVLMAVLLLAQNQRLGTQVTLRSPVVDNSQAYIQALAAVLHKASSYRFVAEQIARAERQHLQKALGFGEASQVEPTRLQQAWTQKMGQSDRSLTPLLTPPQFSNTEKDSTFVAWLAKLQAIRQRLIAPLGPKATEAKSSEPPLEN